MTHVLVEVERNISSAADAKRMVITGFHSIEEKIRAAKGKENNAGLKLFYSKPGPRVKKILAAAKEAGITAEQTDDKKLDSMVSDLDESLRDHRGIVMEISGEAGAQKKTANIVDNSLILRSSSVPNSMILRFPTDFAPTLVRRKSGLTTDLQRICIYSPHQRLYSQYKEHIVA